MKAIHNTPDGIALDAQIYPLELLAATAARLLEGNDYEGAVERAVALLNACEIYQGQALRNKTLLGKIEETYAAGKTEGKKTDHIPFKKALKQIYKKDRWSRNLETHLALTAYRLGLNDDPKLLDTVISQERKQGFLPSEVASLTKDYNAIPAKEWSVIVGEYKRHCTPSKKSEKSLGKAQKPRIWQKASGAWQIAIEQDMASGSFTVDAGS
jgi:hypothetical protein